MEIRCTEIPRSEIRVRRSGGAELSGSLQNSNRAQSRVYQFSPDCYVAHEDTAALGWPRPPVLLYCPYSVVCCWHSQAGHRTANYQ